MRAYLDAGGGVTIAPDADGLGTVTDIGPAPADIGRVPYVVAGGALVPDLAALRARQRALINAGRDAAQEAGADTPSGRFDSTPRSLLFLNGAVAAAQAALASGLPYALRWTRADGLDADMDALATIAAGLAVAAHIDAMHQRGRVLKARINAAATPADIQAVTWSLEDTE